MNIFIFQNWFLIYKLVENDVSTFIFSLRETTKRQNLYVSAFG